MTEADAIESLSFEDGKALSKRLALVATGEKSPNQDDPYEMVTHDTWASMRANDPTLTEMVFQQALLCLTAQADEARLNCKNMSSLLRYRIRDAGAG